MQNAPAGFPPARFAFGGERWEMPGGIARSAGSKHSITSVEPSRWARREETGPRYAQMVKGRAL